MNYNVHNRGLLVNFPNSLSLHPRLTRKMNLMGTRILLLHLIFFYGFVFSAIFSINRPYFQFPKDLKAIAIRRFLESPNEPDGEINEAYLQQDHTFDLAMHLTSINFLFLGLDIDPDYISLVKNYLLLWKFQISGDKIDSLEKICKSFFASNGFSQLFISAEDPHIVSRNRDAYIVFMRRLYEGFKVFANVSDEFMMYIEKINEHVYHERFCLQESCTCRIKDKEPLSELQTIFMEKNNLFHRHCFEFRPEYKDKFLSQLYGKLPRKDTFKSHLEGEPVTAFTFDNLVKLYHLLIICHFSPYSQEIPLSKLDEFRFYLRLRLAALTGSCQVAWDLEVAQILLFNDNNHESLVDAKYLEYLCADLARFSESKVESIHEKFLASIIISPHSNASDSSLGILLF